MRGTLAMLCVVSALVLMSVNSNTAKPLGGFFSVPIEDNGTSSLLGEREVGEVPFTYLSGPSCRCHGGKPAGPGWRKG